MTREYLSCAATAKLVRQALNESFKGIKFSVRSRTYSGGASIDVSWTDGPNTAQVEAITKRFCGSYFDGGIDFKGSVYHLMDGKTVHFGADSIHTNRNYSDAAIQRAIDRCYRTLAANFERDHVAKPTVAEYRRGALFQVSLRGLHFDGRDNVHSEISAVLWKNSDRLAVASSKTAARVFVTHDDGYSRSNGSGYSAVPTDLH